MPDYIQVLRIEPMEGSRDFYRLQQATVHLYARADSEAEAKEIMRGHLESQEWTILDVGKAGLIDTTRIPNSTAIRSRLETGRVCADIHFGQPPEDICFSKN